MAKHSSKREEIYEFLCAFLEDKRYAPSVREIMEGVGLRSTASVHYHLNELERRGLIRMEDAKTRSIRLTRETERGTPLVGAVAAGQPILAVEQIEDYIPWEGEEGCFALRVRGDSMVDAGILPGDLLVIRPQSTAENGEIVVALLEDEATVKRLKRQNGEVWLMPENPLYAPIDGRFAQIIGKVRTVIREYS